MNQIHVKLLDLYVLNALLSDSKPPILSLPQFIDKLSSWCDIEIGAVCILYPNIISIGNAHLKLP